MIREVQSRQGHYVPRRSTVQYVHISCLQRRHLPRQTEDIVPHRHCLAALLGAMLSRLPVKHTQHLHCRGIHWTEQKQLCLIMT